MSLLACGEDVERTETDNKNQEMEIPFDQEKWKEKDGSEYPYREQMLHSLIDNGEFRSFGPDQVIGLLGQPDRKNDNYLYYTIHQKKLLMWPLHTKSLVIKFTEDNRIEWMKIHE